MSKTDNVHFSSKSCLWSTPPEIFKKLDFIYSFNLDPCATPENATCSKFFTEEDNGLEQDWSGYRVFMNPPYGREIKRWMKKAYEESLKGALVVCLVPSRTDTQWWHDYAVKGQIQYLKGRLKFGNSANSAPFPSAIVVFGANI